jgi:acyl-CoA dehydrogenase
VPAASLLGGEGQAFAISQTRLGGGRIHHAMRTVGQARKALDMMVERALSRTTQGSRLADKQSVQNYIADSYAELMQFRLFVLYVAWRIDKLKDYRAVRHDIAAIKVLTPKVLHDIATTNELPLGEMFSGSMILGLADGRPPGSPPGRSAPGRSSRRSSRNNPKSSRTGACFDRAGR